MKHLYTLFFTFALLATNYSFAIDISEIKKDSIVKIENTDLSLIYYKKTTAVWHNFANFYIVEPTKNWFVYLNSAKLLVEVDYKHKTFYAIIEDELTGGYKRFMIGKDEIHGDIIYGQTLESLTSEVKTYKEYIQIDSLCFSKSLKAVSTPLDSNKVGEYSLSFDKKLLFKTDYKYSYELKPYPPLQAIESIEYPGEDSIADGSYVYPPMKAQIGCSNSGVFNFKKKKWTIRPEYSSIKNFGTDYWLLGKETDYYGYDYSIINLKKNSSEFGLTEFDILNTQRRLEDLLVVNGQSLESFNYGVYSNKSINKILKYKPEQYFINHKNKKKLIEFAYSDNTGSLEYTEFTTYFHDFVIQNNNLGYVITIDDNEIKTTVNYSDTTITHLSTDDSFEFTANLQDLDGKENYSIKFDSNNNTNQHTIIRKVGTYPNQHQFKEQVIDNFLKIDDRLVIMKTPSKIREYYHIDSSSHFGNYYNWETEESEIWDKIDGIWQKSTASFASIEPTKFGYICKTGNLHLDVDKYDPPHTKNVNSTYIILDNDLKAINFADFYNFDMIKSHKFGYVITENLENKYSSFLVNLEGKAVTDAKYDSFLMVEGNLYGITKEGREIIKQWKTN